MRNRFVVTFLHWLSTVVAGSVLSGLISPLFTSHFDSEGSFTIIALSLVFGGLFSIPAFLFSLIVIPLILKKTFGRSHRILYVCSVSAGLVIAGFFFAAYMLNVIDEAFKSFGFVLAGFSVGSVLSSIYWTRKYTPDSNIQSREIDALDADLMN